MKYRFLGTSAAEGIPALFCDCPVCNAVRKGENGYTEKDVRTRSQSMVNDDLIIDFPIDTNRHAHKNGLTLGTARYLLITHPHMDHFFPQELANRTGGHAKDLTYEKIEILCSEGTKKVYDQFCEFMGWGKLLATRCDIRVIKPYESVDLNGEYEVTAFPAKHVDSALLYLIKDVKENKTVFHCNDTAALPCEVLDFMQEKGIKVDFVQMDCTLYSIAGHNRHMGYKECVELKNELIRRGIANEGAKFYINHFTHNDYAPYEERAKETAKDGISVSYDGLLVEI
ncbi:MAG: hypothetical protein IKC56_01320 [Clostridia bacterium]|nr:hypothetical protein [Clostridia bacterium]